MLLITLLSIFSIALAKPTPINLAPRCGTTLLPSNLRQIKQSSPTTIFPSSPSISISQSFNPTTSTSTHRVSQLIGFSNIPSSAHGCTLNVAFPSSYPITSTGYPTVNIYLFKASAIGTTSWSNLSSGKGTGLFGTTQFVPGMSATINSVACSESLGFVLEIADWVWGAASVSFEEGNGAGVFLTYNC